jgi:hypothetical protein
MLKKNKALDWANQVISEKNIQIANYLYEYARICENFKRIKRFLDIRFRYTIIHGTLERYLEGLGLDVYYDENSKTIKPIS